ncbi:MAG: ribonuclease E inhibitor RraB [Idiomarina sp.]
MNLDLDELRVQSRETVAAMLADGLPADEDYVIEHHIASTDFSKLEKAAVELVKLNYHVDDADEFELDDGSRCFAFVAVAESQLDEQLLDEQTCEVAGVAKATGVEYDGWGTYLGDEEDEDEGDFDEDDYQDDDN